MWLGCIPMYFIQLVWVPLSPIFKIGRQSKYLLAIYWKWLNLFWVTIVLNFSIKFTNRLWKLLNPLLPPTLALTWTKLKQDFLKRKNLNRPHGFGRSTIDFLYGHIEKNLKTLMNNFSIILNPIWKLFMNIVKVK